MTPGENLRLSLSRMFTMRGRAGRPEFWWWSLLGVVVVALALAVEIEGRALLDALGAAPGTVFAICLLAYVPSWISVAARRLHDVGHSAWWLIVALVPVAGWLLLLWWFLCESAPRLNRHGKPPPGIFWT